MGGGSRVKISSVSRESLEMSDNLYLPILIGLLIMLLLVLIIESVWVAIINIISHILPDLFQFLGSVWPTRISDKSRC